MTSTALLDQAPATRPPVAKCSCGKHYTSGEWVALPWVGELPDPEAGEVLQMRNCSCGSTIGRVRRLS